MNDKRQDQSHGVRPRTPITFFMRLKKVIKKTPPRFAALRGFPRSDTNERGCATRTIRYAATCSNITSDLADVVCQLSRMASCFTSARLNLRFLAFDRSGAQGR